MRKCDYLDRYGCNITKKVMTHLRNVHLFRILNAMETKEKSTTQIPKKIKSMDELNCNNAPEPNPICFNFLAQDALIIDKSGSLSLWQDQALPQFPSHVITEVEYSDPLVGNEKPIAQNIETATDFIELAPVNELAPVEKLVQAEKLAPVEVLSLEQDLSVPSSRVKSISTSSESSSSSNASSTSSSSSSSSTSEKDFSPDDADCDPDYALPTKPRQISFSANPENSTSTQVVEENNLSPAKENIIPNKRKRKGLKHMPMKQETKRLRNCGQQYTSTSKLKKVIPNKQIGPTCGDKCRLKCREIISQEDRKIIFDHYWKMGDLSRQRDYLAKCIDVIKPKYQYKVHNSNRGPKHSFSFEINSYKHRICKLFFKNTLAINNRPIATVIAKKKKSGTVEEEKRGKHGKQHKINLDIIKRIKIHIDSIPRIESHYLRQQTTREYIDGGKNLTDLFTDYQKMCLDDNVEAAKIHTYRKVFNEDYNIGFYIPKKDQCELCITFKNAVDKTINLQNRYDQHQIEKELCRLEKSKDKAMVQKNYIVACYDLQAVLPLPKGDISTLYYKCKLNVCNFTISELAKDYCDCFVWSEVEALRGANEISSCVLRYLTKKASEINDSNLQITFYSDNCCGQQKNKFMFTMYVYAVSVLKIKSITHKYLISGHTQNENDSVHSVIEKAVKKCLRSGPIYTPDQYVTIIRTARKKGNPYNVTEMCYLDFVDIKNLTEECGGQFSKNIQGEIVRMSDIKIIKFEKHQDSDHVGIYYKTSYLDTEFKEIQYHNNRSSRTRTSINFKDFQVKTLYQSRLKLSVRKTSDLKSLIDSNVIPQSYALSY